MAELSTISEPTRAEADSADRAPAPRPAPTPAAGPAGWSLTGQDKANELSCGVVAASDPRGRFILGLTIKVPDDFAAAFAARLRECQGQDLEAALSSIGASSECERHNALLGQRAEVDLRQRTARDLLDAADAKMTLLAGARVPSPNIGARLVELRAQAQQYILAVAAAERELVELDLVITTSRLDLTRFAELAALAIYRNAKSRNAAARDALVAKFIISHDAELRELAMAAKLVEVRWTPPKSEQLVATLEAKHAQAFSQSEAERVAASD